MRGPSGPVDCGATDNAGQQAESSAATGIGDVRSSKDPRWERCGTSDLYPSGTINLYRLEGAYGYGDQCQRGPLAAVPPHSAGQ